MAKWQFARPGGPWEYPTYGFTAVDGAILDGALFDPDVTVAPDAFWTEYLGGSAETGITRWGVVTYANQQGEPADGAALVYNATSNTYEPQAASLSATIGTALEPVEDRVDAWLVRGNNSVPRLGPAAPAKAHMACSAGHGWTIAGTNVNGTLSTVNSTDQALLGSQCVRVTTNGAGASYASIRKTVTAGTIDPDLYDIRFQFYFPAGAQPSLIKFYLLQAGVGGNDLVAYSINGGSTNLNGYRVNPGVLNTVEVPLRALNGSGTWANFNEIRMEFTDDGVTPATVYFYGATLVRKPGSTLFPNGVLSISADDSAGSQWSVIKPAFDARGWKMTLFPIVDQLDGAGNITTAQLRTMHAQGHEVGFHATTAATHAIGHSAMTPEQRAAEYAAGREWMADEGFFSPSFAWPLGNHDPVSDADCAKYFSAARTAFASHGEPLATSAPYARQAINAGTQYSQIATWLPKAVTSKGWLHIMLHAVRDSGGTGNDITVANFNTMLTAIESSGIDVLPMGEVIRTLSA